PEYQRLAVERLARVNGAQCAGDYGVQAACAYQGLFLSSPAWAQSGGTATPPTSVRNSPPIPRPGASAAGIRTSTICRWAPSTTKPAGTCIKPARMEGPSSPPRTNTRTHARSPSLTSATAEPGTGPPGARHAWT